MHVGSYPEHNSPIMSRICKIFKASINFSSLTREQIDCSVIICGPPGTGKSTLIKKISDDLGIHFLLVILLKAPNKLIFIHFFLFLKINCYDIMDDSDVITRKNIKSVFDKASAIAPCILILKNIEAFSLDEQSNQSIAYV